MVKLNLNIGRSYDGYGEQVVDKEEIVLTDIEAGYYLTQFIEEMEYKKQKSGLRKQKEQIMRNKVELLGHYGSDETHACSAWTSTSRELTSANLIVCQNF